jgi:hypothetical protein
LFVAMPKRTWVRDDFWTSLVDRWVTRIYGLSALDSGLAAR